MVRLLPIAGPTSSLLAGVVGASLVAVLAACATTPATPTPPSAAVSPGHAVTTSPSPSATVAAPGALPSSDITFPAEGCAADEACRRLPVARITGIPLTTEVPCRSDGTACILSIDLYYPAAPPVEGGAYPLAVIEPGGPEMPRTESLLAPLLAGQGVVVVDGSWRQATPYGGGGSTGLADIACAVLAARALGPEVGGELDRVTLVGHSLGAWAGAVIALTPDGIPADPAECRFGPGDPTPEAFAGLAGPYPRIRDATDDRSWTQVVGVDRATDPEAWAAMDPIGLVERHGAPPLPILLVHGGQDGTVAGAESEALATALTAAGRPTEVVVAEGSDHGSVRLAPATILALLELLGSS